VIWLTTIKDIAEKAGVSPSTVSNVLNGRPNVGAETRERVLKICDEWSFHPNFAGKSLKARESNIILFNFSDFDRHFYLDIINGISDYASTQSYDLIVCTNKSCEKFMRSSITTGCIMLDYRISNDTLTRRAAVSYPIITLDRILEHPNIKSIVVDNYSSTLELVRGLLQRGYKRFAFLGGIEGTLDSEERYKAFSDELSASGIVFDRVNYLTGNYRENSGKRAAQILMLSETLPEVLVCANDNMAIGAIKAFRENGLRVPEDIAVTGFDNSSLAEAFGLTTVAIPNYERGWLAAQYLIGNIRGMDKYDTFKISAKVIWRDTVQQKRADK